MTSVRIRSVLANLPPYRPGRTPAEIARESGRDHAIKLASNEVPLSPPAPVVEAIQETLTGLNRYPDFHKAEFCRAVAAHHDVAPEQVTASAGSVALLGHLVDATAGPGDEIVFGWRSFEAYVGMATAAGAQAVRVPLDGSRNDLTAIAAAVTDRTRLVIVNTPNNPTGGVVQHDQFVKFMDAVPDDVLVVVDEAYRDFVRDPDVARPEELAQERGNLAVLRTFSKAYGLAGLRAGYCLSTAEFATELRKVQLPFGMNSAAQAAALACLRPDVQDVVRRRCADVVVERDRVLQQLADFGVPVADTEANFYWLELGERSAEFARECEGQGIIVRPYQGSGVRVTVGLPEENDAFLSVVRDALHG